MQICITRSLASLDFVDSTLCLTCILQSYGKKLQSFSIICPMIEMPKSVFLSSSMSGPCERGGLFVLSGILLSPYHNFSLPFSVKQRSKDTAGILLQTRAISFFSLLWPFLVSPSSAIPLWNKRSHYRLRKQRWLQAYPRSSDSNSNSFKFSNIFFTLPLRRDRLSLCLHCHQPLEKSLLNSYYKIKIEHFFCINWDNFSFQFDGHTMENGLECLSLFLNHRWTFGGPFSFWKSTETEIHSVIASSQNELQPSQNRFIETRIYYYISMKSSHILFLFFKMENVCHSPMYLSFLESSSTAALAMPWFRTCDGFPLDLLKICIALDEKREGKMSPSFLAFSCSHSSIIENYISQFLEIHSYILAYQREKSFYEFFSRQYLVDTFIFLLHRFPWSHRPFPSHSSLPLPVYTLQASLSSYPSNSLYSHLMLPSSALLHSLWLYYQREFQIVLEYRFWSLWGVNYCLTTSHPSETSPSLLPSFCRSGEWIFSLLVALQSFSSFSSNKENGHSPRNPSLEGNQYPLKNLHRFTWSTACIPSFFSAEKFFSSGFQTERMAIEYFLLGGASSNLKVGLPFLSLEGILWLAQLFHGTVMAIYKAEDVEREGGRRREEGEGQMEGERERGRDLVWIPGRKDKQEEISKEEVQKRLSMHLSFSNVTSKYGRQTSSIKEVTVHSLRRKKETKFCNLAPLFASSLSKWNAPANSFSMKLKREMLKGSRKQRDTLQYAETFSCICRTFKDSSEYFYRGITEEAVRLDIFLGLDILKWFVSAYKRVNLLVFKMNGNEEIPVMDKEEIPVMDKEDTRMEEEETVDEKTVNEKYVDKKEYFSSPVPLFSRRSSVYTAPLRASSPPSLNGNLPCLTSSSPGFVSSLPSSITIFEIGHLLQAFPLLALQASPSLLSPPFPHNVSSACEEGKPWPLLTFLRKFLEYLTHVWPLFVKREAQAALTRAHLFSEPLYSHFCLWSATLTCAAALMALYFFSDAPSSPHKGMLESLPLCPSPYACHRIYWIFYILLCQPNSPSYFSFLLETSPQPPTTLLRDISSFSSLDSSSSFSPPSSSSSPLKDGSSTMAISLSIMRDFHWIVSLSHFYGTSFAFLSTMPFYWQAKAFSSHRIADIYIQIVFYWLNLFPPNFWKHLQHFSYQRKILYSFWLRCEEALLHIPSVSLFLISFYKSFLEEDTSIDRKGKMLNKSNTRREDKLSSSSSSSIIKKKTSLSFSLPLEGLPPPASYTALHVSPIPISSTPFSSSSSILHSFLLGDTGAKCTSLHRSHSDNRRASYLTKLSFRCLSPPPSPLPPQSVSPSPSLKEVFTASTFPILCPLCGRASPMHSSFFHMIHQRQGRNTYSFQQQENMFTQRQRSLLPLPKRGGIPRQKYMHRFAQRKQSDSIPRINTLLSTFLPSSWVNPLSPKRKTSSSSSIDLLYREWQCISRWKQEEQLWLNLAWILLLRFLPSMEKEKQTQELHTDCPFTFQGKRNTGEMYPKDLQDPPTYLAEILLLCIQKKGRVSSCGMPLMAGRTPYSGGYEGFCLLKLLLPALFDELLGGSVALRHPTHRLGSGCYGNVMLQPTFPAFQHPRKLAVKFIPIALEGASSLSLLRRAWNEILCLEKFNYRISSHSCVLHTFGVVTSIEESSSFHTFPKSGVYALIMSYYPLSLKQWRQQRGIGSGDSASPSPSSSFLHHLPLYLWIFQHICEAVVTLHSHKIIHYDLKCENIVLLPSRPYETRSTQFPSCCNQRCSSFGGYTEKPLEILSMLSSFPKIAVVDFGEAIRWTPSSSILATMSLSGGRIRGTECTCSPERLQESMQDELSDPLSALYSSSYSTFKNETALDTTSRFLMDAASDVWSLGCLFYELLTGEFLFKEMQTLHQKVLGNVSLVDNSLRQVSRVPSCTIISLSFHQYHSLLEFLEWILQKDPRCRPTAMDVLRMSVELQKRFVFFPDEGKRGMPLTMRKYSNGLFYFDQRGKSIFLPLFPLLLELHTISHCVHTEIARISSAKGRHLTLPSSSYSQPSLLHTLEISGWKYWSSRTLFKVESKRWQRNKKNRFRLFQSILLKRMLIKNPKRIRLLAALSLSPRVLSSQRSTSKRGDFTSLFPTLAALCVPHVTACIQGRQRFTSPGSCVIPSLSNVSLSVSPCIQNKIISANLSQKESSKVSTRKILVEDRKQRQRKEHFSRLHTQKWIKEHFIRFQNVQIVVENLYLCHTMACKEEGGIQKERERDDSTFCSLLPLFHDRGAVAYSFAEMATHYGLFATYLVDFRLPQHAKFKETIPSNVKVLRFPPQLFNPEKWIKQGEATSSLHSFLSAFCNFLRSASIDGASVVLLETFPSLENMNSDNVRYTFEGETHEDTLSFGGSEKRYEEPYTGKAMAALTLLIMVSFNVSPFRAISMLSSQRVLPPLPTFYISTMEAFYNILRKHWKRLSPYSPFYDTITSHRDNNENPVPFDGNFQDMLSFQLCYLTCMCGGCCWHIQRRWLPPKATNSCNELGRPIQRRNRSNSLETVEISMSPMYGSRSRSSNETLWKNQIQFCTFSKRENIQNHQRHTQVSAQNCPLNGECLAYLSIIQSIYKAPCEYLEWIVFRRRLSLPLEEVVCDTILKEFYQYLHQSRTLESASCQNESFVDFSQNPLMNSTKIASVQESYFHALKESQQQFTREHYYTENFRKVHSKNPSSRWKCFRCCYCQLITHCVRYYSDENCTTKQALAMPDTKLSSHKFSSIFEIAILVFHPSAKLPSVNSHYKQKELAQQPEQNSFSKETKECDNIIHKYQSFENLRKYSPCLHENSPQGSSRYCARTSKIFADLHFRSSSSGQAHALPHALSLWENKLGDLLL
ncbi:hypothetical protein IE077_004415 [Cardiosporidium cionae]|uniref:Protein kinase domain-containing protein n=1 Tax=Cardiosporidium cionae TaxID=476202 RepID=A0ABQ7JFF5_9APIC|nr:hypothetical protein IE077_004415 [Cardiosporidium cionae]|eukprot:KAF8822773.1 hypothetical protein IE077_004415 [Cardiosporidium cionae]